MQFTLFYNGPLKSKGSREEKHAIRQSFHRQLKFLWAQRQLQGCRDWVDPNSTSDFSILREHKGFTFAPLVCEKLSAMAELELHMLWQQPAGSILNTGGDIDNRLKTLFDALKMPVSDGELPPTLQPEGEDRPFFCLLEDDILISKLTVHTDRLLEASPSPGDVCLFINVRTVNLTNAWKVLP